MNQNKLSDKYEKIQCGILFAVIVALCVYNGVKGGYFADYTPVNGDFQNYNVVRRFLNGQAPYRDFACYLGLGHLWLGSGAAFAFGMAKPVLQSSVMAFDFLSMFAFCAAAIAVLNGVFAGRNSMKKSLLVTNILVMALEFKSYYEDSFLYQKLTISEDVREVLHRMGNTGNSARHLRGMAPVVFICVYYLVNFILKKLKAEKYSDIISCAVACGSIILYSNDYGIATAVVAVIAVAASLMFKKSSVKEKIRKLLIFVAVSAASFVLVGQIATFGNFKEYIQYLSQVSGSQAWYYLSGKSYFLYDIETDMAVLVQLALCLVYILIILIKRFDSYVLKRCGTPLFFNLTAYAAANEYRLLSGSGLKEVSYSFLWVTLAGEIIWFAVFAADKLLKNDRLKKGVALLLTAVIVVGFAARTVAFADKMESNASKDYYTIDGIGRIINHGEDLLKIDERIDKNAVIFPTYASAPDVMRKTFQPSGYDYIIHVLGDEAREKYLDSFFETSPDYVVTINPALDGWEYWISNANWFFYREFYKDYIPEYASKQFIYWKKAEQKNNLNPSDAEVVITEETPGYYKVEVFSASGETGTIDAQIDYSVAKTNDNRSKLIIMSMLGIENTTSGSITQTSSDREFNLPQQGCVNIPVDIVDGYGVMYMKSYPENYTYIDHMDIQLGDIYTVNWEYLKTASAQNSGKYAVINYTPIKENCFIAERANEVYADGKWYAVSQKAEGQIYIECKSSEEAKQLAEYLTEYNCVKIK